MSRLLFLLFALIIGLGPGVVRAQTILYFTDFSESQATPHFGAQALRALGLNFTSVQPGGGPSLASALLSGNYAFVLIEAYSLSWDSTDSNALVNYISGGGRAVVNYYDLDMDPSLQSALGVSASGQDLFVPQQMSIWDLNHPAVSGVPSIIEPLGDLQWNDNGDSFTLLQGSIALAGYSPSPGSGSAVMVLANGGRTIVNGFLATDFAQGEMVALFSSQISTVSGIPEPSSLVLGLLGLGLLPVLRLRARSRPDRR